MALRLRLLHRRNHDAVNFIDGLDGLASGMIAIGAGSFFVYSYIITRLMGAASYATTASLIVIALLGVCTGFLWFNSTLLDP